MHTVAIIKSFYEEYFTEKEDVVEEETVMVCKEVPKSTVEVENELDKSSDENLASKE